MNEKCDDIQPMMSGYLDDELAEPERAVLENHLAACEACQQEFDKMKQLVTATSDLHVESPPEELWDTFLDGVYNRMERQTGWLITILGAIALAAYGLYLFITQPWGPALIKLLIAAPVVGLTIVFISVLRQRLFVAKTDRYSKEVQR